MAKDDAGVPRRGAILALPALATAAAASPGEGVAVTATSGPGAIVRQALRVAELRLAEEAACRAYGDAEAAGRDTAAEDAAVGTAFAAWDGAMRHLAAMPAASPEDALWKLATCLRSAMEGGTVAEGEVADSVLADLARLAPELEPALQVWAGCCPAREA